MSNTIKLKRGSGSDPSSSDLVVGEVALRTDNASLFTKKDDGTIAEIGASAGVSDGDKGDIVVSNSGSTFLIDSGVIDNANVASDAAIAGSKIDPDFTSNLTISTVTPEITFIDTTGSPDYKIRKQSGHFMIMETGQTNDTEWRFSIRSGGTINIPGNLDVGAGIDVTGNIDITDGTLIIDTNPNSPNTNFGLQEAIRIDDNGATNDRGLNIYEYHQSGSRFFSLNYNLASSSTGSAYQYTQGNYADSTMLRFDGTFRFFVDSQVTSGSSDVITPTQRFLINTSGVTVTGSISVSGTVDGVDIATRDTLFGGLTSSSGVLTNGVTATTQAQSDNSTKVSTTAYVRTAISNLINSAPSTLDTLKELSDALGADANFSTTVTNSLATKLPLAGGTLSGDLTVNGVAITGSTTNLSTGNLANSTQLAVVSLSGNNNFVDLTILGGRTGRSMVKFGDQDNYNVGSVQYFHNDNSINFFTNGGTTSHLTIASNGAISVSGTVDGRDLATDGSKLDGIEANATADQTASEILTLIKTVDGAGSGLNADLLDGISSASFLRSDADDTMSANLTIDNGTSTTLSVKCDNAGLALIRANGDSQGTGAVEVGQADNYGGGIAYNGDGTPSFASGETSDHIIFYRLDNGTRTEVFHYPYNSNTVNFNARPTIGGVGIVKSDDTIASATNADTVDSLHASSFLRSDANDTATGVLTLTSSSQYPLTINSSHNGKIVLQGSSTPYIRFREGTTDKAYIQWHSTGYIHIVNQETGEALRIQSGSNGLKYGVDNTYYKVWHEANDGSGSGLDSDKLDGQEGSYYSNAANLTGTISDGRIPDVITPLTRVQTVEVRGNGQQLVLNAGESNGKVSGQTGEYVYVNAEQGLSVNTPDSANANWSGGTASDQTLITGTAITIDGNTVFHQGNDGSGSGLDSDTVDGIQASSFLRSDADDVATRRIRFENNVTDNEDDMATGTASLGCIEIKNTGAGNDAFMAFHGGNDFAFYLGLNADINDLAVGGWSMGANKYRVWHAGNDGDGSGLDADTLDGAQPSVSAGNNTIVKRHSSGYIFANYFNTTANDVTTNIVSSIMVESNNDNYIRHGKAGAVRSFLNVEDGATADQTASEILSLLVTVDGSGSGLDADTLDGIGSSAFLRSNANDTATGEITLEQNSTSTTNFSLHIRNLQSAPAQIKFSNNATNQNGYFFYDHRDAESNSAGNSFHFNSDQSSTAVIIDQTDGNSGFYVGTNEVWHAGNDGSGSGLDSDKLDGQQGSYYRNASNLNAGTIPAARLPNHSASLLTSGTIPAARVPTLNQNTTGNAATASDAALLDGLDSSQFLRSDNSDVMTGNFTLDGNFTMSAGHPIIHNETASRDKIRLWSSSAYAIGMDNAMSFGGLNDYAITFQMNNDNDRGWLFLDASHTDAQGAMSLTTQGKMALAHSLRLAYGESDTTTPGATYRLDVNGATRILGDTAIGDGSANNRILIKKADNNTSDHIIFYNGTTRIGEIGCHDNTWLRINQVTNKNIYTPRYIRADAGFFVDGTSKGINGSGNFIGGTIAGASDYSTLLRSNADDVATHRIQFQNNATDNHDTIATGSGSQGGIEIYNTGAGNDAFMAFHAGGDFAFYFGLDADINDLAVGGWSMGAAKYRVWHQNNDGSGSGLDSDTVDGIQGSSLIRSDANDNVTGHTEWQDNYQVRLGNGADMRLYHNGTDSYIDNHVGHIYIRNAGTNDDKNIYIQAKDGEHSIICEDDADVRLYSNGTEVFRTDTTSSNKSKHLYPWTNNDYDLGSTSLRWRNIYVNDMHFANHQDNPNSVDGTWGDWTLQEGENDIFMINNRTGKKFKIAMIPV